MKKIMFLDFYRYLFSLKKNEGIGLLVDLIIFVISLIILCLDYILPGSIKQIGSLLVFIFVFSLINVVRFIFGYMKEIKNFSGENKNIKMIEKRVIVKDNHCIDLSMIQFNGGKASWDFRNLNFEKDTTGLGRVLMSEGLNEYLWDNALEIELCNTRYQKIWEFILRNKDIIAPFFLYKYYNSRKEGQFFFNENKLCMGSDIVKGVRIISCFKSNYFNSFLTNEICMSFLQRMQDATIIYDASNFYPIEYSKNDDTSEDTFYLQSIEKSGMNDHIGISTLAFTRDNSLVIRKQGKRTQQNRYLFVPTGSGSCDWSDIRGNSFTDTIGYAMKRELWEENGRKKISSSIEDVGETKILGFYRWLARGGKPEFVGITKMRCSLNEMDVDTDELVDVTNKSCKDTYDLCDMDDIKGAISKIKNAGDVSVPLYMCLVAFEMYHEKRPGELAAFLGFPGGRGSEGSQQINGGSDS